MVLIIWKSKNLVSSQFLSIITIHFNLNLHIYICHSIFLFCFNIISASVVHKCIVLTIIMYFFSEYYAVTSFYVEFIYIKQRCTQHRNKRKSDNQHAINILWVPGNKIKSQNRNKTKSTNIIIICKRWCDKTSCIAYSLIFN